ncbi:MAG: RHS repeat protein, partial [Pirellulaceae bacterium]|nr:RHS repeat protein [Pirellulaceae bacterium]
MWGCCRAVSVVATSNPLTNDAYTRYYAYDAAGRLTRYTDRMGRTTEYTYFASGDAEGRI